MMNITMDAKTKARMRFNKHLLPGPDLGLGKLGSCPGAATTRGVSIYVLSPFIYLFFGYSRIGWASTVPLLKAAQGPPQPGGLYIRLVTLNLFWYSRVGWAFTAPLLKAAQGLQHV